MKERFDEGFDEARFLRAVANNKKQTAVMSWEEKANYIQPVVDFFKLRTDPSFGKLLIFADTIFGRVESRCHPALPHQTVRAVFPHTAFRCSSL